mgnify:CR=1 FL=1|tara:strand:- start:478 stop:657 length:180 start_codon:yes stop_codon:yes gene_type:complete
MLNDLLKATVGLIVKTPVSIVADILTCGGAAIGKDEPYTATAVKEVFENLDNVVRSEDK